MRAITCFIVRCPCGVVVRQCRCPSENGRKEERVEMCIGCLEKVGRK